jgi:hypothetical protein
VFYALLADAVAALHLAFIIFVVFGGLLVIRNGRAAWLHLPAAGWGAAVELAGWYCPLTPIENALRRAGGEAAYAGDFIGRWIDAIVYPGALTRGWQLAMGAAVIVINVAVYGFVLARRRRGSA